MVLLAAGLWLAFCAGTLGRSFWTPDEPREADIAWRMSWQSDKAVPELAGEAFCEKPPFTYWAAAASIRAFGTDAAWAVRVPNLLYALLTALGVGFLARRAAGWYAGLAAAAAISTFLLSYQVAIWLATDAPLLAAASVALAGAYMGFYASGRSERLRGYTLMHVAMGVGFLCKSAAAWMVPVLTLITLIIWERRWRELLRYELYVGILAQAALILTWVGFVYAGADGVQHLKVFFWNNLVGRFVHVDAPEALQYAAAHRNSPGRYFLELPMYLWPWTLLVVAAARRAYRMRRLPAEDLRPVRFALASAVPALLVLSFAATARNIYLAPALPGIALLLGWWARNSARDPDPWDVRAVRATAMLLILAVLVFAAALGLVASDSWHEIRSPIVFVFISCVGLAAAAALAVRAAIVAGRGRLDLAQWALVISYCALLIGPASQLYPRVDAWQDLPWIGRSLRADAAGRPLILMTPDETTRAFVDMYASTSVALVPAPIGASSAALLQRELELRPRALVFTQLPGRTLTPIFARLAARFSGGGSDSTLTHMPDWINAAHLRITHVYALPNGRRYALLEGAT